MRKSILVCSACLLLSSCGTFDWGTITAFFEADSANVAEVARKGTLVEDTALAPADRALELGKTRFAQGHYGLALQAFRAALEHGNESVRALNGLAASYDKLGRFDLSDRYYAKALALAPASPTTLNNLGYSNLLQGRNAEAAVYFEQAAALAPDSDRISANLALAREGMGISGSVDVAELAQPPARRMWIERTAGRLHTLVTRADPAFLAEARRLDVDPRIVSSTRAHSR